MLRLDDGVVVVDIHRRGGRRIAAKVPDVRFMPIVKGDFGRLLIADVGVDFTEPEILAER